MKIPAGKKIKIRENGEDIFEKNGLSGIEMYLDSEITISLASSFEELLSFGLQKNILAFTSVLHSFTGYSISSQFKEMGYRMWTKTEPIKFSATVKFNMTYSGEEEVLKPMKVLMKLPLPSMAEKGEGFGLVPPGPSILTAMGEGNSARFERSYSLRCGPYYFKSVVIEKAEPTFSTETDDRGFPIWGQIQLDVCSLFTATTQDIDDFGKDIGEDR
jgi:hypothetical protein